MDINPNQNKAVNDIIEMIVRTIGEGSREVDTTEAIASTARLAGSFMFRSFEFDIKGVKPGTAMLSEEANIKGPHLVDVAHAVLAHYGIEIDNSKITNSEPQISAIDFVDNMNKIQSPALEIMNSNGLSFVQLAQSAAAATGFVIQQSSHMEPEVAFGTAVYHFIEGTKTCPPAFEPATEPQSNSQDNKDQNTSNPWWKFW